LPQSALKFNAMDERAEAAQAGPYAPKHAPLTAGDLEGNAGAAAPAKKPTKRVNLADVKSFRASYVTPRAKKGGGGACYRASCQLRALGSAFKVSALLHMAAKQKWTGTGDCRSE